MCTVTYIPTQNGFHLTSNRDEHISRGHAIVPVEYDTPTGRLLYPKDPDKNGSWIAAKNNGDVVVLLNGAFVKHTVQPNYRKSRGLILMDIISSDEPAHFYNELNLDGIEPFTLVLYAGGKLYECRWDGEQKRIASLNTKTAYIWSSVTLYDKVATAKRNNWFDDWKRSDSPKTTAGIMHFHRTAGNGDLTDGLIINRDGKMKTMSITNIQVRPQDIIMTYRDLKDDQQYVNKLSITNNVVELPMPVRPQSLRLRSFFIRLFNWEYWPFNAVYSPIIFYWFWLSFKSRSFFFFSTANPSIENGGFANESKKLIYDLIPQRYYPTTLLFKAGETIVSVKETLADAQINYPLIAKPDVGGRGVQVKLIHNEDELRAYIKQIKVDFLLQDYVPYKNEVGIFYYRLPGESKGHISGIVGKEFLTVTGDGRSTIEALMIKESRYLLQLPELRLNDSEGLKRVLAAGENYILPYGNHARGAKFIDLSHLITEQLTEAMDVVCRQIPEFYFGRLDVMYDNWEELSRGENFSIIELNGAGSEPTHIYDPMHSIFFAWREIIRHWKLLQQISDINKQRKNLSYMTYKEGISMLKKNSEYVKLVA